MSPLVREAIYLIEDAMTQGQLEDLDSLQKSVNLLNQALQESPKIPEAYATLAFISSLMDMPEQALAQLKLGESYCPGSEVLQKARQTLGL